jgi:hypothetical protein
MADGCVVSAFNGLANALRRVLADERESSLVE